MPLIIGNVTTTGSKSVFQGVDPNKLVLYQYLHRIKYHLYYQHERLEVVDLKPLLQLKLIG